MWFKLLSIGKSSLPYLAAGGAVVAVLAWVYDIGGDNREAAIRAHLAEQQEKVIAEAEKAHRDAISTLEADYKLQLSGINKRLQIEQQKEAEIRYVKEFIVDDQCKRMAIDVIGLFQRR